MMRIHVPEIVHNAVSISLQAEIRYAGHTSELWYSVAPEWAEYLTPERSDAFVVALLPIAMSAGEDIHVAGAMSEKLYYNLKSYYIPVLRALIPSLKPVTIIPERMSPEHFPSAGKSTVVTGFSGGVDSFCVLADHLYDDVPDTFRVTHLLFNNVGSHGRGEKASVMCQERFARLLPAAQAIGLPFIKIDSNLDDLFPAHLHFQLTHTSRNISAVLAMQRLFARYLYASGFPYQDCHVGETYDMAYADPAAVHLLSTETTECISTGSQHSRVEKTMRICNIELTREFLDICVTTSTGRNCSACWKCVRTMLTLEILGKLHLYDRVFDLAKYSQIRRSYIGKILFSKDPLLREIRQLAQGRGYEFPFMSRPHHVKNALLARARRLVRKATRRRNLRTADAQAG
jgi:hypothetical protein